MLCKLEVDAGHLILSVEDQNGRKGRRYSSTTSQFDVRPVIPDIILWGKSAAMDPQNFSFFKLVNCLQAAYPWNDPQEIK